MTQTTTQTVTSCLTQIESLLSHMDAMCVTGAV